MANTTISSGNVAQVWDAKFFEEYVRMNQFAPYMGKSENNAIQVRENLTKKRGDVINVALVKQLTGSGVTGATTLKGNEEALSNYGHGINIDVIRNGVIVNELEEQKTEIAIREAARTMLKYWSMDKLRDDIISAMQSPVVDGVTKYADASEAQKDAWLAANSDRVLFGAATSNNAANDHSAALAECDTTTDTLDTGMVSLAKRLAKGATNGGIRPIRVDGQGEWYVMFCPLEAFRDLKADSTMTQANREAWVRGKTNPLFTDGDLMWDGVIIKEIPEIATIGTVGASSAAVHSSFLCGAQAIGIGWAQRTVSRTELDDYGFEHGVAIQEMRGVEKLTFNSVQHGMVTVYSAYTAD
jgi:N4-gp56 family major capsid protein